MPTDNQDSYYPPPTFLFNISIDGMTTNDECSFQEVSGLNVAINTEEVKEGGSNTFSHKLPANVRYNNLVVKRGLLKESSLILIWVKETLEQFVFTPRNLLVKLLDHQGLALVTWRFQNAYPVAIKIGDFNALNNAYMIETIEFAYDSFVRVDA